MKCKLIAFSACSRNKTDIDLIVATGSTCATPRVQVHCFSGHIAAITLVKWAPRDNMIFSTGQDGNVYG